MTLGQGETYLIASQPWKVRKMVAYRRSYKRCRNASGSRITWFGRLYNEVRAFNRPVRSYGLCERQRPERISSKHFRRSGSSHRSIEPPTHRHRLSIQLGRARVRRRTIDMGRMNVPLTPGESDTKPICIAQGRREIDSINRGTGFEMIKVVHPLAGR